MLQPEIADIIHNCRICHNLMQGVFHQIFIKGNVFRIIPPELFDVAVKTVALPRLGAAEMNDGSLRADGLIVQIVCGIRCPCGQVVDFGIKRKNSGKFFLQEKWLPGCVTIQIEKQYPVCNAGRCLAGSEHMMRQVGCIQRGQGGIDNDVGIQIEDARQICRAAGAALSSAESGI